MSKIIERAGDIAGMGLRSPGSRLTILQGKVLPIPHSIVQMLPHPESCSGFLGGDNLFFHDNFLHPTFSS